ncbi:hypothetical protein D3C72_1424370 [compost metagenome]
MVQLPSAPNDSGNSRPAWAAASWTACSTQPASTVMVSLSRSTARTRFMRSSDSTTADALASGVAAATWPVLPPCGTTGTPAAAHTRITRATSSLSAGRSTASARPVTAWRQSVR